MNIKVEVDQIRKPPLSLDFGICELNNDERKKRKYNLVLNFCIFFVTSFTGFTINYFNKS